MNESFKTAPSKEDWLFYLETAGFASKLYRWSLSISIDGEVLSQYIPDHGKEMAVSKSLIDKDKMSSLKKLCLNFDPPNTADGIGTDQGVSLLYINGNKPISREQFGGKKNKDFKRFKQILKLLKEYK